MTRRQRWAIALLAGSLLSPQAGVAAQRALVTERAVLVMRHGIRAPLPGEVPASTRTAAPWPKWSVADSLITPRGARALEIVAAQDRKWLASAGLLAATGCPEPGSVRITSNSSPRTIASGDAYARGFAPGCDLTMDHRPLGTADPLFEPLRAHATAFDGEAAVADIDRSTGGMAALVHRHRRALRLLDRVLGCGGACIPAEPGHVSAAAANDDIVLMGPIRDASGVAQVLLLQYLEGMPADQVGWGRADAATLRQLGALHAALFAVYTRPPYMAAHQSAALGRRIMHSLAAGPKLDLLMGHDTNVTALAALLGVQLVAPGYAVGDVPPGGGLLFERLRDRRTSRSFVRVSYRTQEPTVLRAAGTAMTVTPLRIRGCHVILCPAAQFERLFALPSRPPDDSD